MELSLPSAVAMPMPMLFLLLLLPLFCFICLRRGSSRKQKSPDGLKSYPIIGTLPHFVMNQDHLVEWSTAVLSRCPTQTMSFNFKNIGLMAGAITANPANIEYMVKTNFQNYPKGEFVLSIMADFLGHGIFNSDGEQWLSQRKAASYEFSKRSLRNFVVSTVRFEVVERLLPLLSRAEQGGATLDVQDVLERFAFDNICCIAFDEDPACLAEPGLGLKGSADFMHAFNDVQLMILTRFMSPVKWAWRVKKLLKMEPETQLNAALATVHGYVDRIVRERSERGAAGLARKDDFLSRFASSGELGAQSLRDVVTSFIMAGRDTTSSALTWFFWLLTNHPDVEERIVREVAAVRASSGSTDAAFSFDELREMQYLHAAISESMRLYPPVAMDSRCCLKDDTMPDGTFVGKGWQVSYNAYAMGRIEEIWGKDCAEYRPERWLDEEGAFRPENSFKYPIFHAGPRMCLGKEMAYIQMKSIVACVLERYTFQYVGAKKRPGLLVSVTLRMEGGLPMKVKKRNP
uniref:Uncharacterized protein n=1 Tax=Avena sativa TaxID=4498 RepID=A0ACD5W4X0_AVESA